MKVVWSFAISAVGVVASFFISSLSGLNDSGWSSGLLFSKKVLALSHVSDYGRAMMNRPLA